MSYSDAYDPQDGVAIVGLAGRFPGARNADEFWTNLVDGRETISSFEGEELDPAGPDELEARVQPNYVRSRGILEGADLFDAEFFGINPSEAAILDPQQRIFMETAWEALEIAGHEPRMFDGAIGVFAGMSNNTYWLQNLAARRDVTDGVGWAMTMMGNEKDYLATRVAYKLDLRGPALNLQTACSTSLVAVITAVQNLQSYACDMALAGGVSVTLPQRRGYLYQEGGILSPDGHCRSFDEHAEGTVFSNGVGVVALRRLTDALEDGNTIYAVIKGTGMNNDGSARLSFTAPSVDGQAAAIVQAQALAGIDPATISYVECHGTATQLGDPVEIAGLTQAFRAGGATGNGFCGVGSVKSNIGHLDAAAGVAGLIKTTLALHHETLPPSLHFVAPNPKLELESSPFHVVASTRSWQRVEGAPRRAGVSSFGAGGTNAHVVLEEAPAVPLTMCDDREELIVLSARTATALEAASSQLQDFLEADHRVVRLSDVGVTLARGRRRFAHRRAVVARDRAEAATLLASPDVGAIGSSTVQDSTVAFLFPGQGAQSVGMGRRLYDADAAFRADLDACAEILRPHLELDLREVLYPEAGAEAAATERLGQTAVTQPALFAIEYALAQAWLRLGVEPDGMIGHSVGEYVAACLAGVFRLEDALRLVAERGRLIQQLPSGTMLAIRGGADEVRALMPESLDIAGENAPNQTVVSGETAAVAMFESVLSERDLAHKRLATSHAFHSAMMDPILEQFGEIVDSTPRAAPARPWVSSLTGGWITDEQARDSRYWVDQLRLPVRFAVAVETLLENTARLTLEVGPGRHLTGLTKQSVADRAPGLVTLGDGEGPASLLRSAGELWIRGVTLDWDRIQAAGGRRVPLPTYPFERKRHWVEGAPFLTAPTVPVPTADDPSPEVEMSPTTQLSTSGSRDALVERLQQLFAGLSGMDAASLPTDAHYLELGLDSLFLTQAALQLQKTFGVKVSFRELLDDLSTIDALATHLAEVLPSGTGQAPSPSVEAPAPAPAPRAASAGPPRPMPAAGQTSVKAFGPYRPPARDAAGGLTPEQGRALAGFVDRYTRRTAGSKASTVAHRFHLADPRTVAGFRPVWKEIVYPIVSVRSAGSRIWDVDGNEYIDLTNGFGTIMFGHNPPFIREAVQAQLEQGIETGPQTPLAGEVAERVAEMVGMERVGFCNTGSEAVTAAIRLARTVSGRDKIAMFAGAYHGIFDEVLVRPTASGSMPIAPGVPMAMVDNVVVLEWAEPSALDYLEQHGHELAAVLVEPVQSRRPDVQPREFLHSLRRITERTGSALVFDEVVTGFRAHPGGAQAIFGVRADIATYGKVIGGGLPIGLVGGRAEYMDALDGGAWDYGDDSFPEVGVTFFAGTFVRHPLALAAARAVMNRLEAAGPDLQRDLNLRTGAFVTRLEGHARSVGAPIQFPYFSSWLYVNFPSDVPNAPLFHAMMRDRGVHIWEGRAWFLTTEHTDDDLERVFEAFCETIEEMQAGDLLPGGSPVLVPGARLGRDADGLDAWFVPDPDRPGKYLQVEEPVRG